MKKLVLLVLCLTAAWSVAAKVELPEFLGDNMVLQQNAEVKLWGRADPGEKVGITSSWGQTCAARADADGRWEAQIKTPAGSYQPQRLTVGDRVIANVLIGEVWLASGQSNMEMPLNGFWDCPIEGANEVIARAGSKSGKLRYVKIPKTPAQTPQERVVGQWVDCSPATAPDFSATAYFYAELLNEVLDVPVGIIDCTWGGSRVESWMNRELLSAYSDIDLSPQGIEKVVDYMRPLLMYNGMLHPLVGYTIRGFLWYQGESNVGHHEVYAERLATMVSLWRDLWKQGELPFYFVEIAPFVYAEELSAYLREAQCRAQDLIPSSGMACTNDLVADYERTNIHPRNKRDIGLRLAYHALNKTYGMSHVACESPRLRQVEMRDSCAYVWFSAASEGFNRLCDIRGFEVCGEDNVFYPAEAWVDGRSRSVVVSSDKVAAPKAVRYGFRNFLPGNLANTRGLPVVPFRTDSIRP